MVISPESTSTFEVRKERAARQLGRRIVELGPVDWLPATLAVAGPSKTDPSTIRLRRWQFGLPDFWNTGAHGKSKSRCHTDVRFCRDRHPI
jgi:hypothetical protein